MNLNKITFSPTERINATGWSPFKLVVYEDSDIIRRVSYQTGYLKRNIEGVCTKIDFKLVPTYLEKIDFTSSIAYPLIFVNAVERLNTASIDDACVLTRKVFLELGRVVSHLTYLINMVQVLENDFFKHRLLLVREKFFDLFEAYCGSRLLFGIIQVPKVKEKLTDGVIFNIEKITKETIRFIDEINKFFLENIVVKNRLQGLGFISLDKIKEIEVSGPNSRCYRNHNCVTYYQRELLEHDIENLYQLPSEGDCFARVQQRVSEIILSVSLLKKYLEKLKVYKQSDKNQFLKLDAGFASAEIEGPRGLVGISIKSDGTNFLRSIQIEEPSSKNLLAFAIAAVGADIEDLDLIFASFDILISEIDK